MDETLLEIICCPVTHQTLRPADAAVLERACARAKRPILAGLVREDGQVVYPVIDGIPVLLPEEGIPIG